jgi:serine/threonine-protein kinase ATR
MARKAGYDQTAYSAVLQAREVDASFAFVQQAKLSRTRGGALKALTELENSLTPLLQAVVNPDMSADEQFARDRNMAKASKDAALLISGCSPSGSMDARV